MGGPKHIGELRLPWEPFVVFGCHRSQNRRKLAGMDGNRTHPGRLNSAPQTVLKTAGLGSATVRQRPLEFDLWLALSIVDRPRPRLSIMLAVNLAVSHPVGRGDS